MTPDSRRPSTFAERLEVHDLMRAVLGPNPEAMDPQPRALFLLDTDLIRRTNLNRLALGEAVDRG